MSSKTKHLLITQIELNQYAGSEIVTLELAEQALLEGFEVSILTNYYGEPISREFPDGINVYSPDNIPALDNFSHIWVHHNFIPLEIFEYIENDNALPVIAFHHMSPFIPIEAPFFPNIERSIAKFVYFNSEETMQSNSSILGEKVGSVLGNPAPDNFLLKDNKRQIQDRSKPLIGIISNHPPDELVCALDDAKAKSKLDYKLIGSKGEYVRVNGDILLQYDAIVTIGKTVQYCILSNVPVYCYDHFGGPGFLDLDNFEKVASLNFSGRGYSKKSKDQISLELINNLSDARRNMIMIRDRYKDKYILSKSLREFFQADDGIQIANHIEPNSVEGARKVVMSLTNISRSIAYYKDKESDYQLQIKKVQDIQSNYSSLKERYDNITFNQLINRRLLGLKRRLRRFYN